MKIGIIGKNNFKCIYQLIMYYKIKIANPKKGIISYFTDGIHFVEAVKKVLAATGNTGYEIEEIKLMKNIKPAINEIYSKNNKLYIIKIAEDVMQDDGNLKTIKYELPVFANNSDELHKIVNDYIAQGLEDMRLTTISETKWVYIK